MDNAQGVEGNLQVVYTADQIKSRVRELAAQIKQDFAGKTICAVCMMENGFVFMADLIREIDRPMLCQFIRGNLTEQGSSAEIFFSPEPQVQGCDVLLVEGVVQSGLTAEYLSRTLIALGAKSVKIATLLDRRTERQIEIQPDYYCFRIEGPQMVGYGLGLPHLGRNLPFLAISAGRSSAAGS